MENLELAQPSRRVRVTQLGITVGLAMLFLVVLLWGLRGITPAHADPGVLYVDGATGQDIVTCGTSGTPCRTISYTLNSRASGGDTIRVAQGVYTENLTITISVTLEGGYEASGWTRSTTQHETIIDGSSSGTVMLLVPGSNGSVLDGFTVRNGQTAEDGGGIYVLAVAQVTIQNCTVTSNSANESGGGISVRWPEATSVVIRDTRVLSNVAGQYGGGIRVGNGAVATIVGSDIVSNTAVNDGGGGIEVDLGSTAVITGNHVLSNTTGGWGSGGILVTDDALVTIHSNEIAWNTVTGSGAGGIRVNVGSIVTVANNHIHANEGAGGGGIAAAWYSIIDVYSNTIADNEAMAHGGGGLRLTDHVTATVDGNVIVNNGASSGGGIATDDSAVTVTNNIIASNYGPDGDGIIVWDGSGVADVRVINNTIISNTADGVCVGGGTVLVRNNILYGNGGAGICKYEPGATVTSDHNAFWNNGWDYANVTPGTGDISADPLFVDAAGGDYHLQADSPCIDAGTPTGAPSTDIEGTLRDAVPDIGAYEWVGSRIFLPLVVRNAGAQESLTLPLEPGCELYNPTLCGAVGSGGARHGRFLVGDSPGDEGLQLFLSYDISGIPAQSEILDVIVDLTEAAVVESPFDTLGCLGLYAYDYGTVDTTTYFTGTLEGAIAEYCSEDALRTQVSSSEAAKALQAKLGSSRFQVRFQFENGTDNDGTWDWVDVESHPPNVIVHYRP